MKKTRLFLVLLALCCLLAALPLAANAAEVATGTCGDDLTWTLTDDGTLTITGTGPMADYDSTSPPWSMNSITKIVICEGVTTISTDAFWSCTKVTDVTIPSTLVSIGSGNFSSSNSLENIYISDLAAWCALDNGDGNGITTKATNLYLNGSLITNLVIPSGVTAIEAYAFYAFDHITSVSFPSSLKSIGNFAFCGCDGFSSVTFIEGLETIGVSSFLNAKGLSSVTLPKSLKELGAQAFSGCSALTYAVFREGTTTIGNSAFYNCKNLATVNFPTTLTSVGTNIFQSCDALISINIYDLAAWCSVDFAGSLIDSSTTYLYLDSAKVTALDIPAGVTTISSNAFAGFSGITSVSIPSTVTKVEANAFDRCWDIAELTVCGAPTLGDYAFAWCSELDIAKFEGNAPTFGTDVFYGAAFVATYPGSNTTWTEDKLLDYGGTITWSPWYEEVASGTCGANGDNVTWVLTDDGTLTISGEGATVGYQYESPFISYADQITNVVMKDGVTTLGKHFLSRLPNLSSVTIPDSVTVIGDHVFFHCTGLTSVKLPSKLQSLGTAAFYDSGLISIDLPANLQSIGDNAFFQCNSLTSIVIPEGVTTLGRFVFSECANLKSVVIPGTVTTMGDSVFEQCTSLTDVTIANGLAAIPSNTFYGCTSLETIVIPDSVKTIGIKAFYDCNKLSQVTLSANLETIRGNAFFSCDRLKEINFPSSLKTILDGAFQNTYLNSLELNEGLETIGSKAFTFLSIPNITVMIPASVKSIGSGAFYGVDGIQVAEGNEVYYLGDKGELRSATELIWIPRSVGTAYQIPAGITSLGQSILDDTAIQELVVPESVTSIGKYIANNLLSSLSKITFLGDAPSFDYYSFPSLNLTVCYPACNDTWTSDKLSKYGATSITWEAQEHIYVDGTCTGCGEAEIIDFYGINLTLGNALDMNFAIAKDSISEGSYAVITRTYSDDRETQELRVEMANWDGTSYADDGLYLIVYNGLAAKEMCDTVSVTVYDSSGNAITKTVTDTIQGYAHRVLDGDYTDAEKTLMVEMLRYGAAAQEYFGYGTEELADALLTDEQVGTYGLTVSYEDKSTETASGTAKYVGTSLILKSRIEMQMGFEGIDDSMTAEVTYTDHYGTGHSVTVNGSDFVKYTDTMYAVKIDGLVVADGRQEVTVVIKSGETEIVKVTDSIESYVSRCAGDSPVFEAVLRFADAANKYFHPENTAA